MSKIIASDAALKVANDAVSIFGGNGYIKDYPVERYARDARFFSIGGGTTMIQKLIVAHAELGN